MKGKVRILLVEDERNIRHGIRNLVDWEQSGFEIVGEAGNGKQAMPMLKGLRPHIVLTDIKMPEMDGIELTKVIHIQYPDIRVIILSGYSDYEYVRTCFRYGAVDYILKPTLKASELLELLKKAASGIDGLDLPQRFYFSEKHAERIIDIPQRRTTSSIQQWESGYKELLKNEEFEAALEHMKHYVDQMIHECRMEEMELKAFVQNAVYLALNQLESAGGSADEIILMRRDFIVQINHVCYAEELRELLLVWISRILSCPRKKRGQKERIMDYIETHCAEHLTLEKLAKEFNYNYNYLSSYFKTNYQKSFTEYLNMVRIQKAKKLLHDKELSITEVSTMVGYMDNSYFSRVFKKQVGMTPADYRNRS